MNAFFLKLCFGADAPLVLNASIVHVYDRTLDDHVRKINNDMIGYEQGDFRPGKGSVDKMFALKQLFENV